MTADEVRIGLNGFGRIGRNVLRAARSTSGVEIVAINDLMDPDRMRYLARYDTVAGGQPDVDLADDGSALRIGDRRLPISGESDPADLPWEEHDVDVGFECTGVFRTHEDASKHLDAGANRVVISAPPTGDREVLQVVYGVNHTRYDGEAVVSNASCTTNSVAPVLKVLDDAFGVESGLLTTVHAYTGSQNLIDGPKDKARRGRAAAENIVPTSTGAAQAATEVLPALEGRLDGMAIRVPVANGSITDLTVDLAGDPSVGAVNDAFLDAAGGDLAGVLGVTDEKVVSSDVVGEPYSTMVDLDSTMEAGDLHKVLTWYDNEFGFANRMLDVAQHVTP